MKSAVEQTLSSQSAAVLNQAVAEARRRGHLQTTSIHVAAAMLSSPASELRQACVRSHHHPPQCRALELCFNVALERLPLAALKATTATEAEAALSNGLVAAIKRAQAQQRRGFPEQQQQQAAVELRHFILSILDDPSVSRVMGEAGFSSTSVKSHLVRMGASLNPSPRLLIGPATRRADEARRVADVLARSQRRNPVLVGDRVACEGVVAELVDQIEKREPRLPEKLKGVQLIRADELNGDDVDGKVRELRGMIEGVRADKGVIVNLGELKNWVEGNAVAELGELRSDRGGLWLMGIATCEMYMQCQARHPLMESSWDVQIVPIAATTPAAPLFPRCNKREDGKARLRCMYLSQRMIRN